MATLIPSKGPTVLQIKRSRSYQISGRVTTVGYIGHMHFIEVCTL
jgi:hypothetical protein